MTISIDTEKSWVQIQYPFMIKNKRERERKTLLKVGIEGTCAVLCLVAQSCPTLCDPVDCSLSGSFVHGILQARILEWIAIPFSRGSSQPRDQTQASHIAGGFFTIWATREASPSYGEIPNWRGTLRMWPSNPDWRPYKVSSPVNSQIKTWLEQTEDMIGDMWLLTGRDTGSQ